MYRNFKRSLMNECSATGIQTILVTSIPSSTSTATTPTSTTISVTSTGQVVSYTIFPDSQKVGCPSSDNTNFTVPGTNQAFQRECKTNYSGYDFSIAQKNSMEECLALCAKYNTDQTSHYAGVVWVWLLGDGTALKDCWLKSQINKTKMFYQNLEGAFLLN